MALDISAITSAVNKYLYSISDVNTLLTESNLSGADSSSNLSGIFEKYLTKAIENASKTGGSKDNMTDEEVAKALTSLKTLSAGLDTSTSSSLNDDSMFSSSLPDLTGLGALSNLSSLSSQSSADLNSSTNLLSLLSTLNKLSDTGNASDNSKSTTDTTNSAQNKNNIQNNAIAEQIAGTFTSLNLEAEIEGAFDGVKNLDEQIKSKIANRDITGEINKSIENLDIKGDIQKSIANHDRSDEINSYNATRLKNYKKQASGTSVFGEYRL